MEIFINITIAILCCLLIPFGVIILVAYITELGNTQKAHFSENAKKLLMEGHGRKLARKIRRK